MHIALVPIMELKWDRKLGSSENYSFVIVGLGYKYVVILSTSSNKSKVFAHSVLTAVHR